MLLGLCLDDLTIDDSLTDLERVKQYIDSKVEAQRLAQVKILHETSVFVGYEVASKEIFPLFDKIINDPEFVIREQFAIELRGITKTFLKCGKSSENDHDLHEKYEEHYSEVLELLLKTVTSLLKDKRVEVRIESCETLAIIAGNSKEEDVQVKVLPIALLMVHSFESSLRVTGVRALNKVAEVLTA